MAQREDPPRRFEPGEYTLLPEVWHHPDDGENTPEHPFRRSLNAARRKARERRARLI